MMVKMRLIGVVLLFAGITQIDCGSLMSLHKSKTGGNLPTPEEGCGLAKVKNTRIVGGSVAPVGAWPWMALLAYDQEDEIVFDCGGSLITQRHVLTAAHCVEPSYSSEELNLIFVRLGEYDLRTTDDGPHQDIRVKNFIPHENYDAVMLFNDIAMIYLERDVEFSDQIRPICLPLDEPLQSRNFVGSNPFVVGFGDTNESGSSAQVLMQLQVPVIDNKLCKQLMLKLDDPHMNIEIDDHIICAGITGGKGAWTGDSGGPLMLPIHQNGTFPFYQIGIVSFTYSCAKENVPDIYTEVQHYADWIKKRVKD